MNIYVGNLAWEVDDDALRKAFEAHGKVVSSSVIKDKFGHLDGKSIGVVPISVSRTYIEFINIGVGPSTIFSASEADFEEKVRTHSRTLQERQRPA